MAAAWAVADALAQIVAVIKSVAGVPCGVNVLVMTGVVSVNGADEVTIALAVTLGVGEGVIVAVGESVGTMVIVPVAVMLCVGVIVSEMEGTNVNSASGRTSWACTRAEGEPCG